MYRRAERAEDADAPVADLVLEPFDHHGAVVGHGAGRLDLLGEVLREVAGGERVEVVVRHQPLGGSRIVEVADLAHESSERPAQLQRTARSVAVPERHLAGLARRRADGDPLERDVLDPPRRRAEHERLARAALVDHLLVELADAGPVGEEHAEEAPVGDRAAAGDGEALRAVASAETVVDAVPHDARAQLGELLTRVAARQQVEHIRQQVVGDVGEARTAPHHRGNLTDRALLDDRHVRDDLLGEHVERVAQVAGRLDLTVDHPARDHCRFEQVAAVLREDRASRRLAHLVAGATDALQTAADRTGRLDLDHEIDGAHVDAELQ